MLLLALLLEQRARCGGKRSHACKHDLHCSVAGKRPICRLVCCCQSSKA